jgi:hypothetical protein
MRRRAVAGAIVAAAVPVKASAHHTGHVPGCATSSCDARIGHKWAVRHPRARAARIVAPYRAFLAKLRACETRGQARPYQTNTGNGFFGAYQFTIGSWAAVGGRGLPSSAPPGEQDYRAVLLLRAQGAGAWPVCSR